MKLTVKINRQPSIGEYFTVSLQITESLPVNRQKSYTLLTFYSFLLSNRVEGNLPLRLAEIPTGAISSIRIPRGSIATMDP